MSLPGEVFRKRMRQVWTEDDLLTAITDAAGYMGWRWHHIRRSDRAQQMGHSGFPDLVLAKRGRVLFLELKRELAQPRPDQTAWQDAINGDRRYQEKRFGPYRVLEEVEARVVTPDDLSDLLTELARG